MLLQAPSYADPLASSFLTANLTLTIAVGLAMAVVVEGAVLWQVLLQQARMLVRIEMLEEWIPQDAAAVTRDVHPPAQGLAVGALAPAFSLSDLNGALTSLDALCALGKPVGLFFVHPTCGPCRALVPHLVRWSTELSA